MEQTPPSHRRPHTWAQPRCCSYGALNSISIVTVVQRVIHADVDGGRRLGDAARGNEVHARFRYRSNRLQANSSRGLERHPALYHFDCAAKYRRVHIVEEQAVRPRFQRFLDLLDPVDLHLHLEPRVGPLRGANGGTTPPATAT